jgi:hypothetical protein
LREEEREKEVNYYYKFYNLNLPFSNSLTTLATPPSVNNNSVEEIIYNQKKQLEKQEKLIAHLQYQAQLKSKQLKLINSQYSIPNGVSPLFSQPLSCSSTITSENPCSNLHSSNSPYKSNSMMLFNEIGESFPFDTFSPTVVVSSFLHTDNNVQHQISPCTSLCKEDVKKVCKELEDDVLSILPLIIPKHHSCPPQLSVPSKISISNFKHKSILFEKFCLYFA